MKKLFVLFLGLTSLFTVVAQELPTVSADQITQNFYKQISMFPQEKIHMHTDKPNYVLGEKIWFRLFVVNAMSNFPESASRYVYTELVNPLDEVVQRVKIKPDADTLYYGHLTLADTLPSGAYTIRAYTGFMKNPGEDYFFRKAIQVGNPLAKSIQAEATFEFVPDNQKVTAHIRFRDTSKGLNYRPQHVAVYTEKGEQFASWDGQDSTFRVKFSLKDYKHRVMRVESGNCKQYISIRVPDNTYDVSFFPEGGHLLSGITCRIAFKTLKPDGLSEEIMGVVVSEAGDTITSIRSVHKGMGFFDLFPEPGKKYYVDCTNAAGVVRRFDIPEARNGAHSLKITNLKDRLYVSVLNSSDVTSADSLFLLIHKRGLVEYADWWDDTKENILFPKKDFPSGISHILLLDKKGNTLSERLIFVLSEDQVQAEFQTDRPAYKSRERVVAQVKVMDDLQQPLAGNFSVSVTDNKDVTVDTSRTILSTILFSSELRGYIEDPSYYLHGNTAAERTALDILLLTQGWRRYAVPDVIQGKFRRPPHPLEAGQCISGLVKSLFRNKGLENSSLRLLSPDVQYADMMEADSTGRFLFCGFEFPDSTRFLVHAFSEKGGKRVELVLDKDTFPEVKQSVPLYMDHTSLSLDYIKKADQRITYENGIQNIFLEEVVITASKRSKSPYEGLSTRSITSDQIKKWGSVSLKIALMNVSGLFFMGDKITYRGNGVVKFLVDGMLTEDELSIESLLNSVSLDDIEQIDLIQGGAVMVYAPVGADAIVAITTKTGDLNQVSKQRFNVGYITPLGYQTPEAFYAPTYETDEQKRSDIPDLRTTIHWEPNVKVSPDGHASFSFYTADFATNYSVVLEGITPEGKLIRKVEQIQVE